MLKTLRLYRLCVVLCTICRSTWGPTGSAFTSGSEPDTDCLLYHVTAGHCFRDTFDAPWENNDIGSVKIWDLGMGKKKFVATCSQVCLRTLPCTDCVLCFVPYAGRLGGRQGLLSLVGLNQTPTACFTMWQPVTVSGTHLMNNERTMTLGLSRFGFGNGPKEVCGLLAVRCAWDPPLYRLCVVLCTICRSTWGPTGSAFTSGSEPDTDCLLYHVAAGHCFRDTFDEQWESNDTGSVKIRIWEWAKRSLWLLVVRCAWDPPLYRLCCALYHMPGRLGGRQGLLSLVGLNQTPTACFTMWQPVHCFRDTFDAPWENNDIGSVKIWIWECAKRSLWLLVVRCAWDPPLYRLCVVLCTICRSTWGPTGSAFH